MLGEVNGSYNTSPDRLLQGKPKNLAEFVLSQIHHTPNQKQSRHERHLNYLDLNLGISNLIQSTNRKVFELNSHRKQQNDVNSLLQENDDLRQMMKRLSMALSYLIERSLQKAKKISLQMTQEAEHKRKYNLLITRRDNMLLEQEVENMKQQEQIYFEEYKQVKSQLQRVEKNETLGASPSRQIKSQMLDAQIKESLKLQEDVRTRIKFNDVRLLAKKSEKHKVLDLETVKLHALKSLQQDLDLTTHKQLRLTTLLERMTQPTQNPKTP